MKNKLAIKRMAIFIFTLVMCISIFQLRSNNAYATTFGGKWTTTIKYYVSDTDKKNYPAYYQRFKTCALIWKAELQMMNSDVLIEEASSSSDANVFVFFETLMGEVGEGHPYPDDGSGPYEIGYIKLDPYNLVNFSDNEETSIMLHEIGHVLGLAHAPKGTDSVMVNDPTGNYTKSWPTSYDINDLRSLYHRPY